MRAYIFACTLVLLTACAPLKTREAIMPYQDIPLLVQHLFLPLDEGRLYTGAHPRREMLEYLVNERKVRTIVSLRGTHSEEERTLLEARGVKLYAFSWGAHRVPPEGEVREVFRIMQNSSKESPVYVHCKAGVDRTGYARAYYRVFAQGWSPEDALKEMFGMFHFPNVLDEDLKKKFQHRTDHR